MWVFLGNVLSKGQFRPVTYFCSSILGTNKDGEVYTANESLLRNQKT